MSDSNGKISAAYKATNKYYCTNLDIRHRLRKKKTYFLGNLHKTFSRYRCHLERFQSSRVNLVNGNIWSQLLRLKEIKSQYFPQRFHFIPVAYAQGKNDDNTVATETTSVDSSQVVATSDSSSRNVSQKVSIKRRTISQYAVTEEDIDAYIAKESGWDRIKMYYTVREMLNEDNPMTIELIKNTLGAFAVGFALGGYIHGKIAAEKFVKKHETSKFQSEFAAKKAFADHVQSQSILKGFKMGLKFSLFMLCFQFTSQTIDVYFNDSRFYHYTLSAAITCGLAKFYHGPVAMAVTSVQGIVLGTFYGLARSYVDEGPQKIHRDDVRDTLQLKKHEEAKARGL